MVRSLHFSGRLFEVGDPVTPAGTRGETSRWSGSDPTKVYVYVGDGDLANLVAAEGDRGRPFVYEVEPVGELHREQGFGAGAPWVPMTCDAATITARVGGFL